MPEIRETAAFAAWIDGLRDERARAAVLVRIHRLSLGNAGDARPVGGGVSEARIPYGPGYRVYFAARGNTVLLLLGGDKKTQRRDIALARALARLAVERP